MITSTYKYTLTYGHVACVFLHPTGHCIVLKISDYLGQLSLAVPPWVGKMSRPYCIQSADSLAMVAACGHWPRNGEFCVILGPVSITVSILTN